MSLKYRWQNVHEWLHDHNEQWTLEETRQAMMEIALKCDSDTLQDIFQEEMDDDGYFEPLK